MKIRHLAQWCCNALSGSILPPPISKISLTLTMLLAAFTGHAYKLTGIVTENGDELPGVTVTVKDTHNSVATNINGRYIIDVDGNSIVVFSFIGMKTVEVKVDNRQEINVAMESTAMDLDEVVVVGYGKQKKGSLTSAISAVKGEELLKGPSTNVSQVLAGVLPGLSSVQESGQPGIDQASLRIRGSRYAVAYIVDGFPVSDINDIDPNDVESVSVLKDGASAAVYGLQGAGGVVIITTKRGSDGKTKVTYDAHFGGSFNANFPKFMNGPQFAHYYNMAQMMDQLASGAITDRSQYVPYFTKENIEAILNDDPTDGWDNVNYIDKVFGTGFTQKHSVTVQGGNEKTKFFTSVGYMGQEGNIDNFNYRRYNMRVNLESNFAKNFNIQVGVSGVVGRLSQPAFNAGGGDMAGGYEETGFLSIANQTIQMHPYLPERYNGLYTASIKRNNSLPQSPLAAIYESGSRKTRSLDLSANFTLTYNIPVIKGLKAKISGSYQNTTSHNKNLNTPYSVMAYNGSTFGQYSDPRGTDKGINLGEGQNTSERMVGLAGLEYNNKFGLHSVTGAVLGEIRDYKSNNLAAYGQNIPFLQLPELNYALPTKSPISGGSSQARSAGYIFRAIYDYDSKYLAEFTGRYDGSYKFYGMSGKQWGFFPSVSAGWRISREKFMEGLTFLNDLKLRGSFGILASDNISEYMFLSTYSPSSNVVLPSPNGNSVVSAIYTSAIANPSLTWEKTRSWDLGLDGTLWNGLLSFELDWFYNLTYDILTTMGGAMSPSMGGYYPTWGNNNRIGTKGVEILLKHNKTFSLAGRPFNYSIGVNVTYSKAKWLRYKDEPNDVEWRKVVGTTVGSLMGWKADGLYRSEEEIDNSAWYGTRPNVGDIKYVDMNGDGQIDWRDQGYFGRSNRPELTYGISLGATWNNFDLNAQFTGGALFDVSLTGTYYNGYDDNTVWTQTFKENANSPLFLVENAYSIDNPNGSFPRLTLGATGHGGDNGLGSTFWWRDGKYIRLKTLQVGYTLPQKWMKRINITNLRIFAEGSNLFTIDSLPEGIDPESPGVNNGYYPQQRTIMGGLTLTF